MFSSLNKLVQYIAMQVYTITIYLSEEITKIYISWGIMSLISYTRFGFVKYRS